MDIAGKKTNISTRPTAPKAFVAALPKALTKAAIKIVLIETRDCWTTDGMPILKSINVISLSRISLLGLKAIILFFLLR
jgi:hypothetical protein